MKPRFQHVGLIGKYLRNYPAPQASQTEGTPANILMSVATCLKEQRCQVAIESRSAEITGLDRLFPTLEMVEIGQQCDLAVVVGGDGTMLSAARELAPAQVPLIGINQGRLGFITDIPIDRVSDTLPPMLQGAYTEDPRAMIHSHVMRGNSCVYDALAFNDVVINRGSTSGMVELRIEVDGNFVCNQRADGLIIATSTGSTAYALSAGGPLMHPSIPGWVLVPIAPHTLSNRPIVLSDSCKVTLELVAGRKASATFDTQSLSALQPGDRVVVQRSELQARFLHPIGWNYFDTLREKLHWNKGGN
ncbi:NAD kinase [Brachymonas sp. M4Q-1]|uniref:NAD kinase n=1 Tax=Brachymonas sp. M4Q-1 TaxID=3416906 RepID=UPI003CF263DA